MYLHDFQPNRVLVKPQNTLFMKDRVVGRQPWDCSTIVRRKPFRCTLNMRTVCIFLFSSNNDCILGQSGSMHRYSHVYVRLHFRLRLRSNDPFINRRMFCGEFDWVRFLVVCFLYKTSPNPRNNICCGKK